MFTIRQSILIQAPMERCFDLARSVEVHLLGNVHWNEQALAVDGRTAGVVDLGERVTWRARHFGFWHTLTSEIAQFNRPVFFQDVMVRGIFRSMTHDHYFWPLPDGYTEMHDVFTVAAPLPLLGPAAERLFLECYMDKLLRERNNVIRQVAESSDWKRYLP